MSNAPALTKKLHALLFQSRGQSPVLGNTWEQLFQNRQHKGPAAIVGGNETRKFGSIGRPKNTRLRLSRSNAERDGLKIGGLKNIDRVFFAMKANSHEQILKGFEKEGLGFECVSPGELDKIFSLFPKIDPKRVLFTPNFAPRQDYEKAIKLGVHVTLDNLFPLQNWPEVFAEKDIFVRLDPGTGRGHHDHVKTAGKHAKFGVPLFELKS